MIVAHWIFLEDRRTCTFTFYIIFVVHTWVSGSALEHTGIAVNSVWTFIIIILFSVTFCCIITLLIMVVFLALSTRLLLLDVFLRLTFRL